MLEIREEPAATKRSSPLSRDAGSKRLCIRDREPSKGAGPPKDLVLEYWDRTDECLERKWTHMELVDRLFASREELILATTLSSDETVLEPNMFPYDTPEGIEHWTLWSRHEMDSTEIEEFVGSWLKENAARVTSWNYDENLSRSIDVFHVHVYFKGPALPTRNKPLHCVFDFDPDLLLGGSPTWPHQYADGKQQQKVPKREVARALCCLRQHKVWQKARLAKVFADKSFTASRSVQPVVGITLRARFNRSPVLRASSARSWCVPREGLAHLSRELLVKLLEAASAYSAPKSPVSSCVWAWMAWSWPVSSSAAGPVPGGLRLHQVVRDQRLRLGRHGLPLLDVHGADMMEDSPGYIGGRRCVWTTSRTIMLSPRHRRRQSLASTSAASAAVRADDARITWSACRLRAVDTPEVVHVRLEEVRR